MTKELTYKSYKIIRVTGTRENPVQFRSWYISTAKKPSLILAMPLKEVKKYIDNLTERSVKLKMARPKKTEQKRRGRPKKTEAKISTSSSKEKVEKLKARLLMVAFLTQEQFGMTDDELRYAILELLD